MQNSLFLRAIRHEPIERTPLWVMRQAGRYLPEYMKVRQGRDFLDLCHNPELACEVTLQPVRRFGFDAAILFSDILVIPEALGQQLSFAPNHGPLLDPIFQTEADLLALHPQDLSLRLDYVGQAIRLIRRELDPKVPLIGFSGSPFTLAVYMVEGKGTKSFSKIKKLLYSNPQLLLRLLSLLEDAVVEYLTLQIQSGVQAVQIFDSWGGILPPHLFEQFSASFMHRIAARLAPLGVPVIHFSRVGLDGLSLLAQGPGQMLGVDWSCDYAQAKKVANGKALQGNLDPTILYGDQKTIWSGVERILEAHGTESGHVFNLGHGILPDIPIESVEHLVQAVREISTRLRSR